MSKVLTCEAAPTGGDILVFGRSIKSDANAIRRMVGVCKQDDYLWPNLSAGPTDKRTREATQRAKMSEPTELEAMMCL